MLKAFFEADTVNDFIDWYNFLTVKEKQAICWHTTFRLHASLDGIKKIVCSECGKDLKNGARISIKGNTVTFKDTADDN